nr:M50 family metallopeptidase [Maliibacterium massiliense]
MQIFTSIWSIIASLLILNVLIVVHEAGHYFSGKRLNFLIPEFSIGMGPKIVSWQRGETMFALRWLPIGGYCRFAGEDEASDNDPRSMNNRPVWARIIVTVSGSLMNLLLGVVIASVTLGIFGQSVVVDQAHIAAVAESSVAAQAGVQAGDRILAVNEREVTTVQSAIDAIAATGGQQVQMKVARTGGEETLTLTPQLDPESNTYRIGVSLSGKVERQRLGFFETIGQGFVQVGTMITDMFTVLGQLFGNLFGRLFGQAAVQSTGEFISIVGVVDIMSTAVRENLEFLLWLTVLITTNLGVVNLLPIPALDGSRLVFQLYELITRKRIPPEKEGVVHMVGFFLMLALFVVLGIRDVQRIIAR